MISKREERVKNLVSDTKSLEIGGLNCHICEIAGGESEEKNVVYMGMHRFREDEIEHTVSCIDEVAGCGILLVMFEVDKWNSQLSPWPAKNEATIFEGDGKQTLNILTDKIITYIKENYSCYRRQWIMGYSLAGLFALWGTMETELFDGVISCSGSLWYPGFMDYFDRNCDKCPEYIYISLGGKEEKSKNSLMASVGECTRKVVKTLQEKRNVKYEINPGGHFADSGKRLAKGIRWAEVTVQP